MGITEKRQSLGTTETGSNTESGKFNGPTEKDVHGQYPSLIWTVLYEKFKGLGTTEKQSLGLIGNPRRKG